MNGGLDYAAIGRRIRAAREAEGITQAELGERADLSTAHIGHIERGTRIASLEAIFCIAQALHTSVDSFLMDAAGDEEAFFHSLASSLRGKDPQKVKQFCSTVRALSEKIDEL